MSEGWHLSYLVFDEMENSIAEARRRVFVHLGDELTLDAARAAGLRAWHKASVNTHRGWDREEYPREPELVYREAL